MLKHAVKSLALVAAVALATPAQAVVFPLDLQVTYALPGNPFGAVVGPVANAGTADTGSQVPAGVGSESISLNPNADAGASLSLTIGTILFGDEDDIDIGVTNDIPAIVLQNGTPVGLDFVSLFEISGTSAIGELYFGTDLGQDTSHFLNTPHYWADFYEDGSFVVGLIVGFEVIDDAEEGDFLEPVFQTLVVGNVVPEPSLAMLAGAGLLGLAIARRR